MVMYMHSAHYVGPHQPMAAVFLTQSSNKVQMTLNDSNFHVNQKKLQLPGVQVIGSSEQTTRK